MRVHFDTLDFIYPGLNQAGGVEISGTNAKGDSLSFYLPMDKAVEFSKDLADFVKTWKHKVKPKSTEASSRGRPTSTEGKAPSVGSGGSD